MHINPTYAFLLLPLLALAVFAGIYWSKSSGYEKIKAQLNIRAHLSDSEYANIYPQYPAPLALEIRSMLAHYLDINRHQVYPDDNLTDDLGFRYLDSLALADFVMNVEKKFSVRIPDDRLNGNPVRVHDMVQIVSELQSDMS